jgi:NitT/TauT family transport system substrate-binding protein
MAHSTEFQDVDRYSRRQFLRFGVAAGLSVSAAGLLQACAPSQPAAQPTSAPAAKQAAPAAKSLLKVRYAVARGGLGDWGSFVGIEKKFFEQEGVDLEHNLMNTFTDVATAVVSNQIDVGIVSIPSQVSTVKQGQPSQLLMATQMATPQGKYNNWWCTLPGSSVTKPTDIKGKKVHVLAANSLAQMVTRTVLRRHGVLPGEYEELSFGFPESYTALKSNRADVGLFIEPFFSNANKLAKDEYGGRELQVIYTMLDAFPQGMHLAAIGVNSNWLGQHREAAQRFVRGQLAAAKWGNSNPDELKQIIAKYAEVPYDNIKDMIPAEMSEDGKFLPGFVNQLQQYMIVEKTIPDLTEPVPEEKVIAQGVLPA